MTLTNPGTTVFLHSSWGRSWMIHRDQPTAKRKSFENPVTSKCKHWRHFQRVPKWTLQALALPCDLLSKELQQPPHPLEGRWSMWAHPRDRQLPGRGDAVGMEEFRSRLFQRVCWNKHLTELQLGMTFYCLAALAIKITSKLAPAVSRFHH